MLGDSAHGKVVIFDDEHYYMGGVLAEKLRLDGHDVRLVTPAPDISTWTHNTMEQGHIQKKLLELGVELAPHHNLASVHPDAVELSCVFTDRRVRHACDTLVLVTERLPNDDLYRAMRADPEGIAKSGLKTIQCIGDCLAPGIIAAAVHSGHLAAREFEADAPGEVPFLRERVML
jgi:dimethylamine/trimethylamine dehydrogenase